VQIGQWFKSPGNVLNLTKLTPLYTYFYIHFMLQYVIPTTADAVMYS
jgi:hypothetical protein